MANSSIALLESQALLHCVSKGVLYSVEMTIGKRIKQARERLQPKQTQAVIGEIFGISAQAVSEWERDQAIPDLDKIVRLSEALKVPCAWLLEGKGPPPAPDSIDFEIEQLHPAERAVVRSVIETFRKHRNNVA